jgi:hypothetical protein
MIWITRTLAIVLMLVPVFGSAEEAAIPPNTINCWDFTKKPDGNWYVRETTFDFGTLKGITLRGRTIGRDTDVFDGFPLLVVLERECGPH